MSYIWELINHLFKFIFSGNNRREYRNDFKTAYDTLYRTAQLLLNQIEMQEKKISAQSERLEELEKIKYLARKLDIELRKCKEAYEKSKNQNSEGN